MRDDVEILELLIVSSSNCKSIVQQFTDDEIGNLINNPSSEIREWLSKAFVNDVTSPVALSALCKLAIDEDVNVRLEAIDSLSAFICHDGFETLCGAMDDDDDLVRAYAAYGIGFVGKTIDYPKAVNILKMAEQHEEHKRVLVGIYEGLYYLGYENYLEKLYGLFDTDDYLVQCAVLHALKELLNERNSKKILQFVNGLNRPSYPRSVLDIIRQINAY